jgi:hypothetical protein
VKVQWSDDLVASLEPLDKGAYINETEFVRHPELARHSFTHARWQKLELIADKYEPIGMFTSPFITE